MYWSDSSNIEVFVTKYSKNNDYNAKTDEFESPLLKAIPTFSNALFKFTNSLVGRVTRNSLPVNNECKKCNYLVAIYPLGSDKAKVNFFRFDNENEMKLKNH
jgi:hypothetical protein